MKKAPGKGVVVRPVLASLVLAAVCLGCGEREPKSRPRALSEAVEAGNSGVQVMLGAEGKTSLADVAESRIRGCRQYFLHENRPDQGWWILISLLHRPLLRAVFRAAL